MIDLERWDVGALRRAWSEARPFPHVVLDRVVDEASLSGVHEEFAREPHAHVRDEIYSQLRSATPPSQPRVRALYDELTGPSVRAAVEAVSGLVVPDHFAG